MKNILLPCTLLLAGSALSGCSSTPLSLTNQACDTGETRLTADFSTGRMDSCERIADNEFLVTLKPENTPINSSPWYAFKLTSDQPSEVKISMQVEGKPHRYLPKVSTDLATWQKLEFTDNGKLRSFAVNASSNPSYIAGQEIINNQYYIDWASKLQQMQVLDYQELGQSLQGRPIYKLESHSSNSDKWLVILGRMHPPELTGALALFPFVETLLSDSALAQQFRDEYNILLVPNLNPDGVHAGNWRHNMNGVDLNRDWKSFKQPEVRAVHKYLQKLVKSGAKMSMAVDFHSTRKDIFYTMPNDYGVEQRYLVNNWLGALDQQYPNFKVIQKPGNNPGKGVFKQYFADYYKSHAITYEMGDNTDRTFIKELAFDAANQLMRTMLEDNEVLLYDSL